MLSLYPGTNRLIVPKKGAANDMMSSRDEIQFCSTSCKTCGINTAGFSECTECVNAAEGLFTDNITCMACPTNSALQAGKCVCATGFSKNVDKCVEDVKKGTCFSPATISTIGLSTFGQVAVWDGRNNNSLILIFNKAIDFSASTLEGKITLTSVKADGSDPVAITGLTMKAKTSLNMLYLSYTNKVAEDRSIKFESIAGFKLMSNAADTIPQLSAQFCPKTDSDISISQAQFVSKNVY